MQIYAVISMQVSVDWLQSVHVVFTARRVVSRVSVFIVLTHVILSLDDVAVSLDTAASTVTGVSTVIIIIIIIIIILGVFIIKMFKMLIKHA